jgi:ABC-type spermidine/putrescine transport system permease subunit II
VKWIEQACQDDETKRYSSTRISVLLAVVTLSLCTVILTIGSFWLVDLVPALTVFGGGLAGMSGGSYMANRFSRPKFTDRGMNDD